MIGVPDGGMGGRHSYSTSARSSAVVVVCHGQVRRQVSQGSRCRGSLMHELSHRIPP